MLSLVASLAALVAALAVAPAAAMEVESVGVIDWQRVHVGVPRTVLEVSVKRQVWATDASVVAGIATRTGAVDWRFVLPEEETLRGVSAAPAAGKQPAVAVDAISSGPEGCTVRRIDSNAGVVVWDAFFAAQEADVAWAQLEGSRGAGFAAGFGLASSSQDRMWGLCAGVPFSVRVSSAGAQVSQLSVSLEGGSDADRAVMVGLAGEGSDVSYTGVTVAGEGDSADVTGVAGSSRLSASSDRVTLTKVPLPEGASVPAAGASVAWTPAALAVATTGAEAAMYVAAFAPGSTPAVASVAGGSGARPVAVLSSATDDAGRPLASGFALVRDVDGSPGVVGFLHGGSPGLVSPPAAASGAAWQTVAVAAWSQDDAVRREPLFGRCAGNAAEVRTASSDAGVAASFRASLADACGDSSTELAAAFAVVSASRSTGAPRLRVVAVSSDALVSGSSIKGALAWTRDEGLSAVRGFASVEPPLETADQLDESSLALASRIHGQIQAARSFAGGIVSAVTHAAQDPEALFDPATASALLAKAFPNLMAKGGGTAFDRTLVMLSRPAGVKAAVLSAVAAIPAEAGAHLATAQPSLWRRSLPLSPRPSDSESASAVLASACSGPAELASFHMLVLRDARTPVGDPSLLLVQTCQRSGRWIAAEIDAWTGEVTAASDGVGPAPTMVVPTGHRDSRGSAVFVALGKDQAAADDVLVGSFLPAPRLAEDRDAAVATLQAKTTVLTTVVRNSAGKAIGVAGFRLATDAAGSKVLASRVWQSSADGGEEAVAWSLPAAEGWQATQASELQVAKPLSDGSLLLQHRGQLVTLITASAAPPGASPAAATTADRTVTLRLLDAGTGRSVYVMVHHNAAGPVRLAWLSDTLAYSYWNSKLHRSELSVLGLYAGSLEPFDLNPLSSAAAAPSSDPALASFAANQVTYVLPTGARALGTTTTRHGVSSRALLVGTSGGGVLSLSSHLINPRRPVGEPSANDKAEGLMPFDPLLPMAHTMLLTHARVLPRVARLDSAPTHMESASIVVASGLDVVVTRATPAASFDALESNFSYLVVIGLLVAGTVAVVVAKAVLSDSQTKQAWQ
ncbi:hypothetical protein FNF31_01844 [Cafeteria roenbergensis]|uniref:ER membrane protein complex subunit 1 n=1 Tax=Cafeteria roenbergensis TaxID=33653 RepID=A0A5A8DK49_CAFRO|nr:hypothetical protein FNF31_01844 [Cafeteria roenbergensis]